MTSYSDEYARLQMMDELSRGDSTVQQLVKLGKKITRELYIEYRFDPGTKMTAELEATFPPILQESDNL